MDEIHLVLAEELERLAAGYRALTKSQTEEISIQKISIILNEKMNQGKVLAIKKLLKKHSAKKLVEVKPEDYKDFYEEAKRL